MARMVAPLAADFATSSAPASAAPAGGPALHRVRLEAGMAGRSRAVGVAGLRQPAAEQWCFGRLADDDPGVRPLLAQDPRDALQGAARAVAGDPVVEPLAGEVGEDL